MKRLESARKLVGVKQSRKAIKEGRAACAYLAGDAEARVRAPLESLCREMSVPVVEAPSMEELGRACGIDVGASVAVLLR